MIVAGVSQWILLRLKTLFRPLCAPSGLGAFALPSEIILMITSHLHISSTTCLALTCRTLYAICFSTPALWTLAEKTELLLLLEKDVATLYFCHRCVRLQPWHKWWSKSISPWYEEHMPCKRSLDRHTLFSLQCDIPYYYARLVMNRHFYGPSHGVPPHKLEQRILSNYPGGVVESLSQHARILDDELLVLSACSMSHSRGDPKLLRNHINTRLTRICAHITLMKGYRHYGPVPISELAKDETTPRLFLSYDQAFESCIFCLTDYSICWHGGKKGYALELRVYRQLGNCRSPFHWSWENMAHMRTQETKPRTKYSLEYRVGYVKDKWMKSEH
jgi:hypothetical protein